MIIECKVCTGRFRGERTDIIRHFWCDYFAFLVPRYVDDWQVKRIFQNRIEMTVCGLQDGVYYVWGDISSNPTHDVYRIEGYGNPGYSANWRRNSLADTFQVLTMLLASEVGQ